MADIFAGCGTTVVAPVTGTIEDVNTVDRWRRSTDVGADRGGRWISIKGDDGVRYYGSHYQSVVAGLAIGTRVSKGQQIATVGDSGNAAGTGCHVHFGLSPTCVVDHAVLALVAPVEDRHAKVTSRRGR